MEVGGLTDATARRGCEMLLRRNLPPKFRNGFGCSGVHGPVQRTIKCGLRTPIVPTASCEALGFRGAQLGIGTLAAKSGPDREIRRPGRLRSTCRTRITRAARQRIH